MGFWAWFHLLVPRIPCLCLLLHLPFYRGWSCSASNLSQPAEAPGLIEVSVGIAISLCLWLFRRLLWWSERQYPTPPPLKLTYLNTWPPVVALFGEALVAVTLIEEVHLSRPALRLHSLTNSHLLLCLRSIMWISVS